MTLKSREWDTTESGDSLTKNKLTLRSGADIQNGASYYRVWKSN